MKKRIATVLAAFLLGFTCAMGFAACGTGGGDTEKLSSSTKPSLPNDEDMQTVEASDAVQELDTFKNALYESENGRFQTYCCSDEKMQSMREYAELENGKPIGTCSMATQKSRSFYETATAYCGIKSEDSIKGAYTTCSSSLIEKSTDSTNPKLDYLNMLKSNNYNFTGIQNDSKMYVFREAKYKTDASEELVVPEEAIYYADDSNMFQGCDNYNNTVASCIHAINVATNSDIDSDNGVITAFQRIRTSCNYVMSGYKHLDLYDESDAYGESEVKDFELIVKKSQTKIYASTKYTLDYKDYDMTLEMEHIILIDLSQPQSIDSIASMGKDLSKLELTELTPLVTCPDVSSEQLTQAVKEGKTITVDVLGGGDIANLKVYGVKGEDLPIVDGKIVIDGAAIKESINNGKTIDKNGNVEYTVSRVISFYIKNGEYSMFSGGIYISYDGNN